jgi:predicted transcriptional regulator of viral defense system
VCITFGNTLDIAHMSPDYDHLYEIAEAQAGYFTATQAQSSGFSWERLSSNVKRGKFVRIKPGVYRLAHFPGSPYEDLFIAWLRTGPSSTISHESALSLYELTDVLPGEVHVIVPRTASRRREGIRLHTNRLEPGDITMRNGLPVTTVERTIADVIVGGLAAEHVRQAMQEALKRGLTTPANLLEQASRRGGIAEKVIQDTLTGGGAG